MIHGHGATMCLIVARTKGRFVLPQIRAIRANSSKLDIVRAFVSFLNVFIFFPKLNNVAFSSSIKYRCKISGFFIRSVALLKYCIKKIKFHKQPQKLKNTASQKNIVMIL